MKKTAGKSAYYYFCSAKQRRGQAAVELAVVATLLMLLVFATIDIGRMVSLSVRMASVAREGGRTYQAMEMENDRAPDEIYDRMKSMLEPSRIEEKGQITFSVLKRSDPNNDTEYDDPDSFEDDFIFIEYQYDYFPVETPNWTSKIGEVGTQVAHYPAQANDIMPLQMLRIGQTTICVEIFHLPTYLTPIDGFLEMIKDEPLYDRAIF